MNMITPEPRIYRSRSLERRLLALQKADKQGIAAAERAESIIDFFANGRADIQAISHKLTKHGELRLRNCLKFDLGGGYRLISLHHEREHYFVFAGSHDDCHRWLENQRHSKLTPHTDQLQQVTVKKEADRMPEVDSELLKAEAELLKAEAEYEARLTENLNEFTLRQLFRGIIGQP